MAEKKSLGKEFSKGIIAENPVLRLVLGTCPTLAVSVAVTNAIGMGIAATLVLVCSNIVISALRKVIPSKVRIPAYIVVIASFVTIVQLFVKAFVPALDDALGVYLPLIVVNCIILGRAEAFAGKNPIAASFFDGLGMGIGFTFALIVMASIRELLGAGSFLDGISSLMVLFGYNGGFDGFKNILSQPMGILTLAPGGFFVFGVLTAVINRITKGRVNREFSGEGCPGEIEAGSTLAAIAEAASAAPAPAEQGGDQ